ncbi:Hypothetical predicted protein [Mytilus galloprovincialis]|uniref:Ion transport domain-containing protein n=1 Tax=Mytilus galloprovincialis TaxID=29158 RepID=A0A8B6C9A2_MYTGA|nr:Hypothetical predicted protein [Mytilus galloprovincialis]
MSLESKPRVVRRHRRAASDDEYNPRQCRHSRPRSNLKMKDFMSPEAAPSAINLKELDPGLPHSSSMQSLAMEIIEPNLDDSFQKEVAEKTQMYFVGRQEAEVEVLIDRIVKREGSKDKALLYVVSEIDNENKVQLLVNTLLHRGANPSASNAELKTALHFAVGKNYRGVCNKLLENDAYPNARDRNGDMPYTVAYDKGNDTIASMLILYMSNIEVRRLYTSDGSCPSEFSFHHLINTDMQSTILAVLDCLIEPLSPSGHMTVYYHILESDEKGRTPIQEGFNKKSKSPLQMIAKSGNKTLVYHDVVRLLIRRKWKKYARFRFQVNCVLYIITLLAMTFSSVVAVSAPDPLVYDTPLQISRAVTEVWTCFMAFVTFLSEMNQLRKHKLEYWHDAFNWIDLFSSLLILSALPLRILDLNEQWPVLSVAYLLWVFRIFKYAAVFRQTGAYAQILWRILAHDFIQFTIVFLVILLAFSGSFILSLKGEHSIELHSETSSFWKILFLGVRILIEAERVIEYTELRPMSCIIMVMFLFTCCVILLNILIAQLSDTYQNVQQDAQRGLEVNRAWIVARVELNSLYLGKALTKFQDHRTSHYKESEHITDVREVLERWETPPLNEMNKYIQDINDSLDSHKMNLLTVRNRLAHQESTLGKIQDQLELLIELQKADKNQRGKNTETSLSDILRGVVEDVQPMKKSSTENNAS